MKTVFLDFLEPHSRPSGSIKPTPSTKSQTGPTNAWLFSAAHTNNNEQRVMKLFTSNCNWNWLPAMLLSFRREHFLALLKEQLCGCDMTQCISRRWLATMWDLKLPHGGRSIIREHRLISVQVPGNLKWWEGRDGTSDSRVNHLCPWCTQILTFNDLSITVCPLVLGYISIYALVRMHWKLQQYRGR